MVSHSALQGASGPSAVDISSGQHPASLRAFLRLHTHRTGWIPVALVPLGAWLSWSRLPATARGTLWAEDIRNFLGDAVAYGPLPALFRAYAGYLHTVPRAIAGLTVAFVPVAGWATAMALGACIVTGVVTALVFITTGSTVPWMPARLAIASITVLVPLAPREVLGNTANLHWYFLWLAPWLLLYRPGSRAVSWAIAVAALLACLTEIQLVLFVPLMLWQRNDRRRLPIRVLYLLGVGCQVIVTFGFPRGLSTAAPVGLASLAYGYLINGVMTIVAPGSIELGRILVATGPLLGLAMILVFVGLAIYISVVGSSIQRLFAITLLFMSIVLYLIAVSISPGKFYDYADMSHSQLLLPWLSRYGVVPSMFLMSLVPLASAVWIQRQRSAIVRSLDTQAPPLGLRSSIPALLAVIGTITVMCMSFVPATTRRSHGPEWQPQVALQRLACATMSPTGQFDLRGAPSPGWKVTLECSDLSKAK